MIKISTGSDRFQSDIVPLIKGKNIAVLCHAASTDSSYRHITELVSSSGKCRLAALFGPQHGLFGQTQDNMIEWEGYLHPELQIPVYSLYGKLRKPSKEMLENIDLLLIDLQDVGTRVYTYVWTMKLCMEACSELGIEVIIIDRPNPISDLLSDGPVLKRNYYSFVGGAEIPLGHGMTIGEIALWLNEYENINADINVIPIKGWNRSVALSESGLPWIMPSPNMPALSTSAVYPGSVLIEALNLSEGRGTTLPFELIGAPFLKTRDVLKDLRNAGIDGCIFREHNFIPTFHKYQDLWCNGIQIHVTDRMKFRPVRTAVRIFSSILRSTPGELKFLDPPYEYEEKLIPFDILSGDDKLRLTLITGKGLKEEFERWDEDTEVFSLRFNKLKIYD